MTQSSGLMVYDNQLKNIGSTTLQPNDDSGCGMYRHNSISIKPFADPQAVLFV